MKSMNNLINRRPFKLSATGKISATLLLLMISLGAQAAPTDSTQVKKAQQIIEGIKHKYAPDKRSEVANVQLLQAEPLRFSIETTKPAMIAEIRTALAGSSLKADIQADTLPSKALNGKIYGVANLSVTNNRGMPGNASEMVTQMLLGSPVDVLKKQRGYYLVRSPDGYLSWVDASGIVTMDKAGMDSWQKSAKVIYTTQYGHAFQQPTSKSAPVSDLVAGNILQVKGEEKGFYKVSFPDQRVGYIAKAEASDFKQWLKRPDPDAAKILATAKTLMGVPYLWGGTSIKGVDCSGFTKTSYFLNGVIIPRDASQQALVGQEVDIYDADSVSYAKCLQNLKAGDLLFFSPGMNQGKQARITHTAIYMGDGQFIESAGLVKISTLDPKISANDDHNLKRLVKARRMLNNIGSPEITRVRSNAYYLQTKEHE